MKILHVFKTYLTDSNGGIEQVIHQICHATAQQGIENRILCLTSQKNPQPVQTAEAEVFRCTIDFELFSTPFSWRAFSTFKKLAAWADIIHYQFPWPFADLLQSVIHPKKPIIVSYQSDIVRQKIAFLFYQPLQNYFLTSATQIVATSPQYKQTSPALKKFADKVAIIPNGLDKSVYPTPSADCINQWKNRVGEGFFLFVGVMRYYKGLHILLEAALGMPGKIVIAGSGPLENTLKAQAERLKLTNVIFVGNISEEDKVALLTLSLGFVFPSHLRSEAFGISLLEAAMYGKPLISTEIGTGTSYININGETGLVVPPADPIAFKQAMCFLYENPIAAKQMGIAAEKRYWAYFTADTMGKSYIALYERWLGV